jgi:hypothetical protein
MASWAPALRDGRRPHPAGGAPRRRHAVLLGGRIVSDRDVVLLARRLGEVEHHLAERASEPVEAGDDTRALREATRARVAGDLKLVSAALERSQRAAR